MKETRVYPTICRSAYCGRINCTGCKHKSALDDFKTWEKENSK